LFGLPSLDAHRNFAAICPPSVLAAVTANQLVAWGFAMRAALHTCVSTHDKGQETANQLNQLGEFCSAQNWPIVVEYEDHESGGKGDRAQFRALMADAAQRKFDVLVFWALGFSREGVAETYMHLKRLDHAGMRTDR
jgi:hypothetical protein